MKIKIELKFVELSTDNIDCFRIPSATTLYPQIYKDHGYTAKVVNFNRLLLTSPYGRVKEYAVSYEIDGCDYVKMSMRNATENHRFWALAERVAIAQLTTIVHHINQR